MDRMDRVGRRALRARQHAWGLVVGLSFPSAVGAAPAAPAKAKAVDPSTAGKNKGAGLYSAGGRVYPAHGDGSRSPDSSDAAYRQWLELQRAAAAKKKKVVSPPSKSAPQHHDVAKKPRKQKPKGRRK